MARRHGRLSMRHGMGGQTRFSSAICSAMSNGWTHRPSSLATCPLRRDQQSEKCWAICWDRWGLAAFRGRTARPSKRCLRRRRLRDGGACKPARGNPGQCRPGQRACNDPARVQGAGVSRLRTLPGALCTDGERQWPAKRARGVVYPGSFVGCVLVSFSSRSRVSSSSSRIRRPISSSRSRSSFWCSASMSSSARRFTS